MKRIALLTSVAALTLAACGSDDGGIAIERAWARTSAEGQTTGAVYFEVTADSNDRLVAASVPATVAARVEIHEVVMVESDGEMGDGMHGGDDAEMGDGEMGGGMHGDDDAEMGDGEMGGGMHGGMDPQMRMQELAGGLMLPAGETVTLRPGGYHVMLLDIAKPLMVGDEIEVTLDFEQADDITLTVKVAETAP